MFGGVATRYLGRKGVIQQLLPSSLASKSQNKRLFLIGGRQTNGVLVAHAAVLPNVSFSALALTILPNTVGLTSGLGVAETACVSFQALTTPLSFSSSVDADSVCTTRLVSARVVMDFAMVSRVTWITVASLLLCQTDAVFSALPSLAEIFIQIPSPGVRNGTLVTRIDRYWSRRVSCASAKQTIFPSTNQLTLFAVGVRAWITRSAWHRS